MVEAIPLIAYVCFSVAGLYGLYYQMTDEWRAMDMVEKRPDGNVFYENLKKAPVKERLHYALWSTHYVKNKPIAKV